MDAAVSNVINAQQNALANQINTRLMRKSLDVAKMQGDAIVQLLTKAAEISQPTPQGKTNTKTPGLGQSCDIQG